jgi:hypothetical protein
MKKKKYLCPICHNILVDIIYGMPCDVKLIEKAHQKQVYLGGCLMDSDNFEYHCYYCDKNFKSKDLKSK